MFLGTISQTKAIRKSLCLFLLSMHYCWAQSTVEFTQISDPAGLVNETSFATTGNEISSIEAPLVSGDHNFTHWSLNGVRQADALGKSFTSFGFTILEPTTITAHFIPSEQDSDADAIPDWFELFHFGHLTHSATYDGDNDGFSLLTEFQRQYQPTRAESISEGGLSRRLSAAQSLIFNSEFVRFTQVSEPIGLTGSESIVAKGSSQTTEALFDSISYDHQFAYWEINGQIQSGPNGRALSSVSVLCDSDQTATAVYVPSTLDSDDDSLLDWFEWNYFSGLEQSASSDPDADGWSISQELAREYDPTRADTIAEGGVSRRLSASVDINLAGFSTYHFTSSPEGFINILETREEDTQVSSPDLIGDINSGYQFAYWSINGTVQSASNGNALSQLNFTLTEDITAIAVYLPIDQDTDADGLTDWFEWNYYSGLQTSETDDSDNDGFDTKLEQARNYNPTYADTIAEGGISRRLSIQPLNINLQPFERLEYAPLSERLTHLFNFDPHAPEARDYGEYSAPLLGDWDGDGDLDLFVLHQNGIHIFENTGSIYSMKYEERTAHFSQLSSLISNIDTPRGAMGDVNNDGKDDLIIGGLSSELLILYSSSSFTSDTNSVDLSISLASSLVLPALGEYTGDDFIDLVITLEDGSTHIYPHSGSSVTPYDTQAPTSDRVSSSITNASSISSANLNGDSLTDLLATDTEGRIWEFIQQSDGSLLLLGKVWGGSGAGFADSLTLTAGDLNADGDDDAIGGFASGGLLALIDPHVGRPANLTAVSGANSVLLNWDPNRQSRILGYNIYRTDQVDQGWALLTSPYHNNNEYLDTSLSGNTSWYYQVTGLTGSRIPGNSALKLLESAPSETAQATTGNVTLTLKAARGNSQNYVKQVISIDNAYAIAGANLEIQIAYNPLELIPATQDNSNISSVMGTGLSRGLTISDNAESANGLLIITSESGTLNHGSGKLFDLRFKLMDSLPNGAIAALSLVSANLEDLEGNPINVTILNEEGIIVSGSFVAGDLTGDGIIDDNDKILLIELNKQKARSATDEEMQAGDLNGDGQLDAKDLVLLLQLLRDLRNQ